MFILLLALNNAFAGSICNDGCVTDDAVTPTGISQEKLVMYYDILTLRSDEGYGPGHFLNGYTGIKDCYQHGGELGDLAGQIVTEPAGVVEGWIVYLDISDTLDLSQGNPHAWLAGVREAVLDRCADINDAPQDPRWGHLVVTINPPHPDLAIYPDAIWDPKFTLECPPPLSEKAKQGRVFLFIISLYWILPASRQVVGAVLGAGAVWGPRASPWAALAIFLLSLGVAAMFTGYRLPW